MVSPILPPGAAYHPASIIAYEAKHPGYNGDMVPVYVARPAATGNHPGVVLVHGVHGYEEHMKDMARRLAVLGYASIVPALYCGDEFLSVIEEEDLSKASSWLRNRPNAQTIGDLTGALAFLQESPYVSDRIGLVGFCSGGRLALIFACNVNGLSAFVNFYSNSIFQPTEVNPIPAGDMIKDLCCPMLGIFGAEDTNPAPDDVARLREELDRHSKSFEIVSYKDAGHAFFSILDPATGRRQPTWPGAAAWSGYHAI